MLPLPHMEPNERSVTAGLLAVLVLVLANAFFVAAEFALVGARRTRLDELARGGDAKARLARRAVQSLDRYISATQLGITLASLGLGWIGEPALAHLIEGAFRWLPAALANIATHAAAVAVAFTIITVLHIILGELVPKALALLYPENVSGWVVAPLMAFAWVMSRTSRTRRRSHARRPSITVSRRSVSTSSSRRDSARPRWPMTSASGCSRSSGGCRLV